MKIITLTLNPAYDIYYNIENFAPCRENYISSHMTSIGGKGINISMALLANGVKNKAFIVLGEENKEMFIKELSKKDVNCHLEYVEGRIRENIIICSENSEETYLRLNNFTITEEIFGKIEEALCKESDDNTIVTFTGRIPLGISKKRSIEFIKKVKDTGAKVIIDTNSFTPEESAGLYPWLIKPNAEEIEAFMKVENEEDAKKAAEALLDMGAEHVIVSLGKNGAVYAGEKTVCLSPPPVKVMTTVGAGDSMIAGFIKGYLENASPENRLAMAIAFGSAACMTKGTVPPAKKDIEEIYNKIKG